MLSLPDSEIDRDSPVPFYFQLAELLEQEITSGRWEPGWRLPSEPDLGKHYGVSRTVVRQALDCLEERGMVSRHKGRGTFIQETQARSWLLQSSQGFWHDEADRMGREVTSRILKATLGPLPSWATRALTLDPGAEGATLERLRWVDGLVALYVVNHVPAPFAETALSLEDADESLYVRLEKCDGVVAAGGRRTLEAVRAEGRLSALLEVEPGSPLAFIESVAWDASGRPFDCYQAWLRTDRMKVEVQVTAAAPALPALVDGRRRGLLT
jgi:GntR family transcriptional regulator